MGECRSGHDLIMLFPFSFWGADGFQGITQNLILFENFSTWFSGWTGIVENIQLNEPFTTFFDAPWNAATQNIQLSEDFNPW